MTNAGYPPPPHLSNDPEKCCPCGPVEDVLLHEATHRWCRMVGGANCDDPPGGKYDPIGGLLQKCLESREANSEACKNAATALMEKYH